MCTYDKYMCTYGGTFLLNATTMQSAVALNGPYVFLFENGSSFVVSKNVSSYAHASANALPKCTCTHEDFVKVRVHLSVCEIVYIQRYL